MKTRLLLAIALLAIVSAGPALAQAVATAAPPTTVSIPWGDWLVAMRDGVMAVVLGLIAWGFRALPSNIAAMLTSARVIQIVEKGIDYGLNSVAGAVKGKTLDVNVGNAVVAQSVQYVVDQAPGWMVKWAGGEDGIRRMIVARLPVAEDAALQ